jgi:hypothetical protein
MEGWIMGDIRTSQFGGIPFGNNANRPTGATGQPYFNGEEKRLELYTASGWQNIVSETPGVVSVSATYGAIGTATLQITGTNFTTGAVASVIGTNGVEINATSTTVNSIVSVTATFTGLSYLNDPYDVKVTNTSNLFGLLPDAFNVNQSLNWQTAAGSLGTFNEQVSVSLSATALDPESATITYSLAAGSSLPSGVTLSSSTGLISGTLPDIGTDTTYTFTVNATDGAYTISRIFSITSVSLFEVEALVVAGGGGGGSQVGGGGGAGGLVYSPLAFFTKNSQVLVTVGSGGAGGPWQGSGSRPGDYGQNSRFGSLIAFGGGGGGAHGSGVPASGTDGFITQAGRPGGSGGGGGANSTNGAGGSATQTSPSGATGYGFSGGTGFYNSWAGGGGGGAGGAGVNSTASVGGTGGAGRQYGITGTSLFYAAGGGGCADTNGTPGIGGSGIGGNGAANSGNTSTKITTDGAANTGSGGGGARDTGPGGDGAAGVVIISYPNTLPALSSIPGTLTYNQPTRAGYRVYRFTAGTGTITL